MTASCASLASRGSQEAMKTVFILGAGVHVDERKGKIRRRKNVRVDVGTRQEGFELHGGLLRASVGGGRFLSCSPHFLRGWPFSFRKRPPTTPPNLCTILSVSTSYESGCNVNFTTSSYSFSTLPSNTPLTSDEKRRPCLETLS